MKGLYLEAAVAGFEIDVAHRPQAEPAAGLEAVQQALAGAGLCQLLLVGPEGFLFDRLEREFHVVVDAPAAFELIAARALKPVRHEAAALGQRVVGGGGYLGERDAVVLPGDDMPSIGDLHGGRVAATLDLPRAMDFK